MTSDGYGPIDPWESITPIRLTDAPAGFPPAGAVPSSADFPRPAAVPPPAPPATAVPAPAAAMPAVPVDPAAAVPAPAAVETVDGAMGLWRALGASVVGNGHVRGGLPRQDGVRVVVVENWVILAVADGAGSAEASDQGAHVALNAATELATTLLVDEEDRLPIDQLLTRVFSWAGKQVMEHAVTAGRPARDFDTTLAVVLIGPTITGFGQIGDAIIAIETVDGDIEGVAAPRRGEYVNETHFITRDRELNQLATDSRFTSELSGVVLSTDGLERVAAKGRVPYPPFFRSVLRFAQAPEATSTAVADFLTTVEDRKGDDKTLLIATRLATPGPDPGPAPDPTARGGPA
ncbi:PP2C family serine/threonine-protein phosphatase [Frankia tisae]|uniref:PP2C family serine/threonine-protein phosphatase n=1 Tax=Frankia tisae TaxID=2950104 RepID=UPI0021C18E54|nr:PP2C family serine/threonine-protein phosphatase [Frankia tisae]